MREGRAPSGASIIFLDEIDSTHAEGRRRAESGQADDVWLTAKRQTAGFGRRARAWQSADEDLKCTLVSPAHEPIQRAGQVSFVAALALYDAFSRWVSSDKLSLKWPNDVLIEGAKAAGILIELVNAPERPVLVMSAGVNIVTRAEDVAYETAALRDHADVARAEAPAPDALDAPNVLSAFDAAFAHWRGVWEREGFAPIREDWLSRARGLGEQIEIRLPNETLSGVFVGIDAQGALILDPPEGPRRVIAAGDVFFSGEGPEAQGRMKE